MKKFVILLSMILLLSGCTGQKNVKPTNDKPVPTAQQEKGNKGMTGKSLPFDGSRIDIKDRIENIVSQDGTKCTFIFEMEAEQNNGIFKGQAMLQSVGIKESAGELPASGMVGIVSNTEFKLAWPQKETAVTGQDFTLATLAELDYESSGTFLFIMSDVGFMALQEKVQDNDMVLDIPYRVIVFKDTAVINFKAPDGRSLSFRGGFAPIEDIDLAPLTVK